MGIEVSRISKRGQTVAPEQRPIGKMDTFLQDLVHRGLRCNAVLDVGANKALWSRMAKKILPNAHFYLMEPQIELLDDLKQFVTDHDDSQYFLKGAGARNEELVMTIWDDPAGSSLLPKEEVQLLESGKQRKIDIVTIDHLLKNQQIKMPDIIKLDVQGFELEALKGAESTFGNTEVYILEVSLFPFNDVPGMPVIAEVINFMLDRNYVVYDFPGFLRRPLDGALGQCDIAFVKKDSFLRKSKEWK